MTTPNPYDGIDSIPAPELGEPGETTATEVGNLVMVLGGEETVVDSIGLDLLVGERNIFLTALVNTTGQNGSSVAFAASTLVTWPEDASDTEKMAALNRAPEVAVTNLRKALADLGGGLIEATAEDTEGGDDE